MERYRRPGKGKGPGKYGNGELTRKGLGRPKGSLNKITRLLKDNIIESAEEVGWPEPVYKSNYVTGEVILDKDGSATIVGYKPGAGGTLGYMMFLACNFVGQYRSLMQATLPDQRYEKSIAPIDVEPYQTLEEATNALKEAGIPIGPNGTIYADPIALLEAMRPKTDKE